MSATVRDSSSYPLVLDPLRINKVTCRSLLTLLDYSSPALTVIADLVLSWVRLLLAVGCLMLDTGQGVFDKKVASLRIPVENILSSRDSPAFRQGFRKRNIDISKDELKRFNHLPKVEQEYALEEILQNHG